MNLLEMSFSGTVFIAAVVIMRAAAINKLPKKMFLALWEMVLFRLLVPFSIPSAFSVYTLMSRSLITPSFFKTGGGHMTAAISQEPFVIVQGMGQLPDRHASVSAWLILWSVGMLLFAAFFAIVYLHCRMEFRTAFPVDNVYAAQWLKEQPLKRRVSIRQSDRISAPLTYGLFRPVILMPKQTDWENEKQLQYVLAHECTHIRHFDAFIKLIAAFALCVHWFNPFVWAMYVLFNRDIELACDEGVLRQFGEESRVDYSLTLIRMEAKKSGLLPFCSNFSKNAMEERITAIMNTKRRNLVSLMSACLIVCVAAALFATSATAESGRNDVLAGRGLRTSMDKAGADKKSVVSITHENAEVLRYEDGSPYIHDILTNHTDKTIVKTQYCMLAYNEKGLPLKLDWNFLDSSAESSYEHMVWSEENLLSGQTEDYQGGWSLYDGEIMGDFIQVGNGGANQAAYALICLKQVVFEDGTVWNNPNYESWIKIYAGKEIGVDELRNYYPYEYGLDVGEPRTEI